MRFIGLIAAEIIAIFIVVLAFKYRLQMKKNRDYFNVLIVASIMCAVGNFVAIISPYFGFSGNLADIIYKLRDILIEFAAFFLIIGMRKNWNRLKGIADFFVVFIFLGYILHNFFESSISLYTSRGLVLILELILSSASITSVIIIYTKDTYFKNVHGYFEFTALILLNILNLALREWPFVYAMLLLLLISAVIQKNKSVNETGYENELSLTMDIGHLQFPIWLLFVVALFSGSDLRIIMFFVALILLKVTIYKYINIYEFNIALTYQYKELNEKLNQKVIEISRVNSDLEDIVKERTQKLELKNEELYGIINIDPITRVANRNRFISYLDSLIERSSEDLEMALYFIDLDRFKVINDWYGHDIGDLVLEYTADKIKNMLGNKAFIGRLGGDEFGIIIDKSNADRSFLDTANQIIEEFRSPFTIKNKTIVSTVSIGVTIYPLNAKRRIDLMKFADIALYKAKLKGKDRAVLYDRNLKREENRKLEIESRLKDGFFNGEFFLNYQPQISVKTQELVSVEALLRWENEALGIVSPAEFITIAEDSGMIVQIGEFVLKNALEGIKYINQTYNKDLKIALNVSPKQFYEIDFLDNIDVFLDKYEVEPSWVELEITENLAIRNEEIVFSKLKRIKERGISIAIDDFGTGYSSFSYIKKYPIDKLKIARELIIGVSDSYEDYKMVKAIIFMCKELNISTIAEGVEKSEQVDILNQLGCDIIQGYYYDKPRSLKDLELEYF